MRVTFGYQSEKGTVISFQVLKGTSTISSDLRGFAVVLADKEQHVSGGYSRFVVVPLSDLKTDPPDRKWGLS